MRLYDNAPNNYHDELASWFPSWYRNVREMDSLWNTWGVLLDQLQADIKQVLDNYFIKTCDEATIEMWESFLGITMASPRDLENRRRFIMMHFGGFGKCSATKIKSIIKQYTGSDASVSFERYDEEGNHWLNIQMDRGDVEILYVGDVQFVLDKIIPAHIPHSLTTVQERNVRCSTTISRYKFEHLPAGIYPETALIGKTMALTETYNTEIGVHVFEENPANPDAVAGIYPNTAMLGRAAELTEAIQTDVSAYPVEYTQASENISAGALPGSSTQ